MISGVHVAVLGENEQLQEDFRRAFTGLVSVRHIQIKVRIPRQRGHRFRSIADSIPMIADS